MSASPYLTKIILGVVFIHLSFYCSKKNLFSLNLSRKFFNTFAFWIPSAAMTTLSFASCNTTLSVILILVSIGANSAANLGYQVILTKKISRHFLECFSYKFNAIDITPNYSGTVYGIANFTANIVTIFATLLTGVIVGNDVSFELI